MEVAPLQQRIESRPRKRMIVLYLYLLLLLLTLLTVASYTWFSISTTPRVSDMYMYVNAQAGMELSLTPDAEEWVLQLNFGDMIDESSPLRPVTWSDSSRRFYAASYGADGRMKSSWEALSDERNANKDSVDAYYLKATYYARSGEAVDVSLTPAIEVDEGIQGAGTFLIGYPEWDSEQILHNNGGNGAEAAVRIGFRITPVDETGQPTGEASELIIYEPNCDMIDGEAAEYVPTASIDGSETLVEESRLILQTSSSWVESEPVQRDVVIRSLGEFTTDPYLFSLEAGQIVQIEMYIWLEGQDIDCTNEIKEARLLANIQFNADSEGQSGLVPIGDQ